MAIVGERHIYWFLCLRYVGFGDIPLVEERDITLVWTPFLDSAYLGQMVGGVLNCTCCPWGNLKGKAAGGCDFWRDKIVFGQNHLGLAIVPKGGMWGGILSAWKCEAVFSVRENVRRYSQCIKMWCKRVGYEYWHIWLHIGYIYD